MIFTRVQDFEEYLNMQLQRRTFVQYYRCLSTSLLNKENHDEDSNFRKPSIDFAICFSSPDFLFLLQIVF